MNFDIVLTKINYEDKACTNPCQFWFINLYQILSNPFWKINFDFDTIQCNELQTTDTFYIKFEELYSKSPKIYPHRFNL
jgi:hypothetical protein